MNINSIFSNYDILSNYSMNKINTSNLDFSLKNLKVDSYQQSQVSFMSQDMYDYSSKISNFSKVKNDVNAITTTPTGETAEPITVDEASSNQGASGSSSNSKGETKTQIKNINGQLYKVVTTTYEDGTTETTTTPIGSTKNNNNNNGEISDTADLVEALMM